MKRRAFLQVLASLPIVAALPGVPCEDPGELMEDLGGCLHWQDLDQLVQLTLDSFVKNRFKDLANDFQEYENFSRWFRNDGKVKWNIQRKGGQPGKSHPPKR